MDLHQGLADARRLPQHQSRRRRQHPGTYSQVWTRRRGVSTLTWSRSEVPRHCFRRVSRRRCRGRRRSHLLRPSRRLHRKVSWRRRSIPRFRRQSMPKFQGGLPSARLEKRWLFVGTRLLICRVPRRARLCGGDFRCGCFCSGSVGSMVRKWCHSSSTSKQQRIKRVAATRAGGTGSSGASLRCGCCCGGSGGSDCCLAEQLQ